LYSEIAQCRICGNSTLVTVLSLGQQFLTGVFPRNLQETITKGPLDLVWCPACHLVQMKQSYDLAEMYGDNYGYRSGLNQSMVRHLRHKIQTLANLARLKPDDLVVDIGSNDATSLKAYTTPCRKIGIDPTGNKFRAFYTDDIILIPDFFDADTLRARADGGKAKVITSIAMFYDLPSPERFVRDVASSLAHDGVWHFEQSYMPSMLRTNAYDTICHEHLEFYSFGVVKKLLDHNGLRVIDVQTNAVNGGSFAVTACLEDAPYVSNAPVINWMIQQEIDMDLDTPKPYREFEHRVYRHRKNFVTLIENLVSDGKKVLGYGASTKGNVLLQFCGLSPEQIPYIAEINEEKYGCFTPGTNIPIVSENEAHAMKPDYFVVLPWHFKSSVLEREADYLRRGGRLIFPLPEIEII
jgi:hypothetical protein